MMRGMRKRKQGQAMVEYIIIVVIVAIAALAIFGVFSDRIREMMGGATTELGGDPGNALDTTSEEQLRRINRDGL